MMGRALSARRFPLVLLMIALGAEVTDTGLLARLAAAWATKWDGRWHCDAHSGGFHTDQGGAALVVAVTPSKILAFGKGTFSQTRHQF